MASISTELSQSNIQRVIDGLTLSPHRLDNLFQSLSPGKAQQPLRPGERSFADILAHLIRCEERTTESIYAALLLDQPLILPIHPERDWGALLPYQHFPCDELLAYFRFRRRVLLHVLQNISIDQWARSIRESGKKRQETVYWRARTMVLHEDEQLQWVEGISIADQER